MQARELLLAGMSTAGGDPFTPVQVQKLFFLIGESIPDDIGGSPFNFAPYDYGPFDRSVYVGLDRLMAEGLVSIEMHPEVRTRCYRLTAAGQEQGEQLLAKMPFRARDYIERASDFVRRLPFAELVASIYKAYPQMKVNSVFRD